MSTLPLTEAILLEIYQSLGCLTYPTVKKNKFATGQASLETHKAMGEKILNAIFEALDIDPKTFLHAIDNLEEFANTYKFLELNTWTFAADQRQILWMLLGYFYAPGLARQAGLQSIKTPLDIGMPGGRFWYLPELQAVNGTPCLYMPVARVMDWLLDLLGMPIEKFADVRSQSLVDSDENTSENWIRSLYNWRRDTIPTASMINECFIDEMKVTFKGAFSLKIGSSPSEQFADALNFVKRKQLTADKLRLEIPMTQERRLEAILDNSANEEEQAFFVNCLAERYSAPSPRIIRQRLLFARMVQDGYVRLLKFLCPNVDRLCNDPQKNKLLQLFGIYKIVYNQTIDAYRHCRNEGQMAEDKWFEEHLPPQYKYSLFIAFLPSNRATSNSQLAHLLTRYFFDLQAGAALEDHLGYDEKSELSIIKRNIERVVAFTDEIDSEHNLVKRMKTTSPWRVLQNEQRFWVVSQVAQHTELSPRAKEAAIQRLRELATTPAEAVQAILLELNGYLNNRHNQWPKDTRARVQVLLDEAEASKGYELWKAPILQYKAKHQLGCNDFKEAGKLFRQALEAASERNYGQLRGEIARDCLALEVANQKLIINNHEKYYREMLAGGMVEGNKIPDITDTARWVADYFWETLYKTYPGVVLQKRRAREVSKQIYSELSPLLYSGNQDGLQEWIKKNRQVLKSNLPDVDGNSILMLLIKMRSALLENLTRIKQMAPDKMQDEYRQFETMMGHWRIFFVLLAKESPNQLNIPDLKGQTPLMLTTENGDSDLVRVMLQAGADPDMQDWHGMTVLHSAIKSRVDSCVDALLDHPCSLDKYTIDGNSPLHTASWTANMHATKRLLQLAPGLAWQRNHQERTPLEHIEYLIENPEALRNLRQQSNCCASLEDLENIVQILEQAPSASTA